MVVENKKKMFNAYELSEGSIQEFLLDEKLKGALCSYNPESLIAYSNLGVKIPYSMKNMLNITMLYYIGIFIDRKNKYLEDIKDVLNYKSISYDCVINDYEHNFLKHFNKIPFDFYIKKIRSGSQLKKAFDVMGIGILSSSLLLWIYCDIYSSRDFDDYIEEFSDVVLDEYYHDDLGSVCDFINFDYSRVPKNNLDLLLSDCWGLEFNLLSIESKELDRYIDSIREFNSDLSSLKCIIDSIYSNLAPEPFRVSSTCIVDIESPLFNMLESKGCKYKFVSLSIKRAYTDWECSDYALNALKVNSLLHSIDKLNQVIVSD